MTSGKQKALPQTIDFPLFWDDYSRELRLHINMWLTLAQNTGEVLNSEKSTNKYKSKCGAVLYKNGH